MKFKPIKNDLHHTCRACLNKKYHIDLQPENCLYAIYPAECSHCKEVKNIVQEIRFPARMRIRLTPSGKNKHNR